MDTAAVYTPAVYHSMPTNDVIVWRSDGAMTINGRFDDRSSTYWFAWIDRAIIRKNCWFGWSSNERERERTEWWKYPPLARPTEKWKLREQERETENKNDKLKFLIWNAFPLCVLLCLWQIHICSARRPIRENVLLAILSLSHRFVRDVSGQKFRRTSSKTTVHQFITSLHLRSNILIQFSVRFVFYFFSLRFVLSPSRYSLSSIRPDLFASIHTISFSCV